MVSLFYHVLVGLDLTTLLQYPIDKILRRTVLGITIIDITNSAADANFGKTNLCHFVTQGGGDFEKPCAVIALFIAYSQDRNAIANAFIHKMRRTVAWWMRTVYIAGLMMGALMPIYETLKLWWSVRIITSKNYWFAIFVPDGHARCHASASFTAVNEMDIFAFFIGTFGWLNN